MLKKSLILLFMTSTIFVFAGGQQADPVALLSAEDTVLAIDTDGIVSKSSYPGPESPANAIDEDMSTKYLNFGKLNTGFIVTLDTPKAIKSFQLTTANDAVERDPANWVLYGTNSPVASEDNSKGMAENWTKIDSGDLALSDKRYKTDEVVAVNNSTAYSSYKMVFPMVKDESTNSMQIGEVALFETEDGSGSVVTKPGNTILAVHEGSYDSSYPGGEAPAFAVDGTESKYLNFGGVNSGIVITPAAGKTKVISFVLSTANDAPERDPVNWELYGTMMDINLMDNGIGATGNWEKIDAGSVELPEARNTIGSEVAVSNKRFYKSYKMIFTGLRDENAIMQIGELQMFGRIK